MATQNTVKQIYHNNELMDIEDVAARTSITSINEAITAINNAIDAFFDTEDTTEAINTMQEVVAFLTGITNEETLSGKLIELANAIASKVSSISYDSNSKKLQKTINGTTSDVVTFASVATSGSYADLSNKPTIPDAQVQSDWNESDNTKKSFIANKPTIPSSASDVGAVPTTRTVNGKALSANITLDGNDVKTPLVVDSQTGDATKTLDSGKYYRFGEVDSLALTLTAVESGYVGVYFGRFTTSANWGSGSGFSAAFSDSSTVTAASSNDTIEASKTYEFNIVDGILKVNEV